MNPIWKFFIKGVNCTFLRLHSTLEIRETFPCNEFLKGKAIFPCRTISTLENSFVRDSFRDRKIELEHEVGF